MSTSKFAAAFSGPPYLADDGPHRVLREVAPGSVDEGSVAPLSPRSHASQSHTVVGRTAFLELVDQALGRSRSDRVGVVCVVIDRWENFGDAAAGEAERAFAVIAARLGRSLRGGDVLARVGPSAFAVLSIGSHEIASSIGDRMITALRGPLALASGKVSLSARVGVTLADYSDEDSHSVLGRAEQTMTALAAVLGETDQRSSGEPDDDRSDVDRLVNELFAAGLLVASCRARIESPLAERLGRAADLLDSTIARLAALAGAQRPIPPRYRDVDDEFLRSLLRAGHGRS